MIPTDLPSVDQGVARVLEEIGFYYGGKTDDDYNLSSSDIKGFFGWQFQIYPVFAVIHITTNHHWLTHDESMSASPQQIRQMIVLERAMALTAAEKRSL